MPTAAPDFELRLARDAADLRAAQRLRYEVFVEELGGDGDLVDHAARLERDAFDPFYDHLLLFDRARGGAVVGVYRLLRDDQAARLGRYYSEGEYDLSALKGSDHGIEVLFGVASFHGTEIEALKGPLSLLHHRHLAPAPLRVRALPGHFQSMDLLPEDRIDRPAAMKATPALIKAYLRLGGYVGEGAFIDHAFNTTDVCLILDTAAMSEKHRSLYTRGRR